MRCRYCVALVASASVLTSKNSENSPKNSRSTATLRKGRFRRKFPCDSSQTLLADMRVCACLCRQSCRCVHVVCRLSPIVPLLPMWHGCVQARSSPMRMPPCCGKCLGCGCAMRATTRRLLMCKRGLVCSTCYLRYLISEQCAMPHIRYPRFPPRVEHGACQEGIGRQVVRAKSGAQRMRRSILGADACKRVGMQRVHVQVYACWQIGKQEKSSGLLKQCPLPLFTG